MAIKRPLNSHKKLLCNYFDHYIPTTTMETAGTKRKATDKNKGGKSGYDVPWVEKYRPRALDDVVGNEDTLVRLRAIAEDGNMPNLILCGPPGTGKVCYNVVYNCCLVKYVVMIHAI